MPPWFSLLFDSMGRRISRPTTIMTQNSATFSQGAGSQGGYGDSSGQGGWQAYYTYAQQLRSAGNQEQAQQYYAYAQQLYIAELQNERQRATAGAQTWENSSAQEYNAKAVEQQALQEYVTEVSPAPTWETYYNYAQQLYAAGHQTEAEAYYRQSQIMYQEAEGQTANSSSAASTSAPAAAQTATQGTSSYIPQETTGTASSYASSSGCETDGASSANAYQSAAGASNSYPAQSPAGTLYSYPPQATGADSNAFASQSSYAASSSHAPQATASTLYSYPPQSTATNPTAYAAQSASSYAPQSTNSYAPQAATASTPYAAQQAAYTADTTARTSAASTWGMSDVDNEPVNRPKRPFKTRLKIWSATFGALVLVVGIGGFFGLLGMYKDQLEQTEPTHDRSFLGKAKRATIQPIVDALSPAFDKTIRLSAAAQPLLYELSLRSTQPENLYPETTKTETAPAPVTAPQPAEEPAVEIPASQDAASPTPESGEAQTTGGAAASENVESPPSEGQGAASDEQKDESTAAEATAEETPGEKEVIKETPKQLHPAESAATDEPDRNPFKEVSRWSKPKKKHRSRHSASRRNRPAKHRFGQQPATAKKNNSHLSDDPLGRFNL